MEEDEEVEEEEEEEGGDGDDGAEEEEEGVVVVVVVVGASELLSFTISRLSKCLSVNHTLACLSKSSAREHATAPQ